MRIVNAGNLYIIIILNINYCLIGMSASKDKNILIRAYQCKIKSKIDFQEFFLLVNANVQLSKVSEKGLFILYLCQMLLKAYLACGLKIINFMGELDKKQVKKRKRAIGPGDEQRKKRKRNETNRGLLDQLLDESVSNPSNIQRPRVNTENRQEDSSNAIKSKDKGDDSNGSKENVDKNNFKIQLNKITQEIRGHDQTYVNDVDFLPNAVFQDNSQSNSSQVSGEISNFSQKIKIFTNTKENQQRTVTTRRKMGNKGLSRQTKTKKKKYQTIDQSTLIEETRQSNQKDLTVNFTDISHFDTHQIEDFDFTKNFIRDLGKDEKEVGQHIFQKDKIELLRNLLHDERQTHNINYNIDGVGMMAVDENQLVFPDYTMSQPTSAPIFEPDFFKQSLQLKDSQFSFKDLINHSSKDKATLFYELLWRQQNDQITISQTHPQTFGEIRIKQK